MQRFLARGLGATALVFFLGCGDSSSSSGTPTSADSAAQSDTSATSDTQETTPPNLPDIPVGELTMIEPGGETICSRGTPFQFFVAGGNVNKIVVDFAGGGACWNSVTCSVAGSIFNEAVPNFEAVKVAVETGFLSGIYDFDNPENPFEGWYLVHIPYCTGDVHWGNAVHDYGNDNIIHHKGYVNVTAALDWVYENFESPEEIFVTGCSAGSYGAIGHSARLAQHYPNAKLAVLGDSGAGIITESFFADSFPNWNAAPALPDWIPAFDGDYTELTIVDVYTGIANFYPQHRFAQYNTAFDSNQEFYFTAMGGDEADWSTRMMASIQEISEGTENFRSYLAPGSVHCVAPYEIFYSREVEGWKLTDWVGGLLSADEAPPSVSCEAAGCENDPVCAACETSDSPPSYCGFCD